MHQGVIYARLSVEDNEKENSINHQIDICKEYIKNNEDICLVRSCFDNGKTGTNLNRDGFRKVLSLMEEKETDCLIVKDLSRVGRNYIECGQLINDFISKRIRIIAVNDGFDSYNTNAEGMFVVAMKNIINDIYSKDLSIKITSAKQIGKINKTSMVSRPLYGFKKKDTQIVEDEDKYKVVKKIFTLSDRGYNYNEIARMLNEKGIETPNDKITLKDKKIWKGSTVYRIINDRRYGNENSFCENKEKIGKQKHLQSIKVVCGCCGYVISPKYYKNSCSYRCQTPYFDNNSNCVRTTIKESAFYIIIYNFLEKKIIERKKDLCLESIVKEIILIQLKKDIYENKNRIKEYAAKKNRSIKEYACNVITRKEFDFITKDFEKKIRNSQQYLNILEKRRDFLKEGDITKDVNTRQNMVMFFVEKVEVINIRTLKIFWKFNAE